MNESEKCGWWRLFDANANRAAEGLRTLEDIARFINDDPVAVHLLKDLRHRLGAACRQLDRGQRLSSRSTVTDVGTAIKSEDERQRSDSQHVVAAAVERVLQSLRCLEEAVKVLAAPIAEDLEQLRYAAYDVLAQVELRLESRHRQKRIGQLCLLVDCQRPENDFAAYLQRLAVAGVEVFQIRDKSADGERLVKFTRIAIDAVGGTDSLVIVNDRADVALAAEADGVHVGQEDLSVEDVRRLDPQRRLLVGVSTHDLDQARSAERLGADYIGCGPTFPSKTKAFEHFPGLEFIRQTHHELHLPIFAIGGIDLANVAQVTECGCGRVAVSRVIHAADHPERLAEKLREQLGRMGATESVTTARGEGFTTGFRCPI